MLIEINDFPLTQIATKLFFKIIDSSDETCTIYYELHRADGVIIERGNEIFPLSALGVIAQQPMDINGLNQLLSVWNLSAKI